MMNLGADKSTACKVMSSTVESLRKEYKDMAATVSIVVWQPPEEARRFGVKIIPSPISYHREGGELHSHKGLMPEGAIVSRLAGGVPSEHVFLTIKTWMTGGLFIAAAFRVNVVEAECLDPARTFLTGK